MKGLLTKEKYKTTSEKMNNGSDNGNTKTVQSLLNHLKDGEIEEMKRKLGMVNNDNERFFEKIDVIMCHLKELLSRTDLPDKMSFFKNMDKEEIKGWAIIEGNGFQLILHTIIVMCEIKNNFITDTDIDKINDALIVRFNYEGDGTFN